MPAYGISGAAASSFGTETGICSLFCLFAFAFLSFYLTFAAPIKKFFIEWLWESCLEYDVITKKNL
jgi:hypothetical protein